MTIELADLYDISFKGTTAEIGKNILKQYAFTIAARFVSQWAVGWIPFLGNSTNAATMTALVEYIGWDVVDNFEKGRSGT